MAKVYPSLNTLLRGLEPRFNSHSPLKVVIKVEGNSPLNMRDGWWEIVQMKGSHATMRSLKGGSRVPWAYDKSFEGNDSGSMAVIDVSLSVSGCVTISACARMNYLRRSNVC